MSLRAVKIAHYFTRYFGKMSISSQAKSRVHQRTHAELGGRQRGTNICQGYDGARHSTGIVR
jgi:hypothetical protein